MAFERKAGPAQSVMIVGAVPNPPPKIPDDMKKRFPVWDQYQQAMETWWSQFSGLLQRDLEQIKTQFTADESKATTDLAALQASITNLTNQISALAGGPTLNSQVASLMAQVAALVANLAAHILATKAHGTIGDIVGTVDTQALESKSIGLNTPGYGRFSVVMESNVIPLGQTVDVPAGYTMFVGDPFEVDGTLNIAGTLAAV